MFAQVKITKELIPAIKNVQTIVSKIFGPMYKRFLPVLICMKFPHFPGHSVKHFSENNTGVRFRGCCGQLVPWIHRIPVGLCISRSVPRADIAVTEPTVRQAVSLTPLCATRMKTALSLP